MYINGAALDDEPIAGDPAVFARLKTSLLSDALVMTDNGRLANFDVIFTGPLVVADSIVRSAFHTRGIDETVVVIDISAGGKAKAATISDAITVVDQLIQSRNLNRSLSEALVLIDEIIKTMNLTRQASDTIIVADEVIGSKVKSRTVSDTFILTDTGRTLTRDVTFEAQITLTEQLIKVLSGGAVVVNYTATDTITITDGTIKTVLRGPTLSDLISVTEIGLGKDILNNVEILETLDVNDQFLIQRLRQLITTDGITLLDFLQNSTSGNRAVTIGENIVFFDQKLTSVLRNRIDTDSLIISESTVKAIQRLSTLTESVVFQDGTLKIRMWDQRIGETVTLSDELQRQIILAVLYDIRIMLGVDPDPILDVDDPILLSVGDPIVLGATD